MQLSRIKSLAEVARKDASVFEKLASSPEDIITDFESICGRVDAAIAGMSQDTAMVDLLASPSNDHCIRSSCGCGGSIIN